MDIPYYMYKRLNSQVASGNPANSMDNKVRRHVSAAGAPSG